MSFCHKARKALKLQSSGPPTDAAADARLEQEARNEERDIKRICDQLGLEMFEVSFLVNLFIISETIHRYLPTDIVCSQP